MHNDFENYVNMELLIKSIGHTVTIVTVGVQPSKINHDYVYMKQALSL